MYNIAIWNHEKHNYANTFSMVLGNNQKSLIQAKGVKARNSRPNFTLKVSQKNDLLSK